MLGFKIKVLGSIPGRTTFFLVFICLPCGNKAKKIKKMYYQMIIFICESKNQEMPLCIKYLNRKGIKGLDGTSHYSPARIWHIFDGPGSRV